MLPSSSLSRIGLLTLVFGVSACSFRGIGSTAPGNGESLGKGGGTAQGGGAGGVVSDGGAAAGGSVGSGGEASGGIIAGGSLSAGAPGLGGIGAGGVGTGGSASGGVAAGGGGIASGGRATGGSGTGGAGGAATGGATGGTGGGGGAAGATGGAAGAGTTPGWGTPVPGGPSGTGTAATVTVDPGTTVGTIGADFTGFSYEKTHIMNGSLASSNTNLIATKNNLPDWRMDENNTCSGHGLQGLSDTLISGLWAIDYMFEVAKRGGSGINFHNGEDGMDGVVPHYYDAIKENGGVVVQVRPLYYGMLLFTQAGTGSLLSTTPTGAPDFTAWAIKANGFTSVVLNNRNASSAVNATVNLGAAVSSASAIYLQGTSTGGLTTGAGDVTLAGAQVSVAGDWPRNAPYIQTVSGNNVSVYVPAASAALVRVLQ